MSSFKNKSFLSGTSAQQGNVFEPHREFLNKVRDYPKIFDRLAEVLRFSFSAG